MGLFLVQSRVDAFVDYIAEIEADDADEAAQIAYDGGDGVVWRRQGVSEFDDRRVVTLGVHGEEIEATARGDL
ncbi:hypothetical protein L2D01_00290 [Hyphomonadaceae bacterium ML37]|nr:hypothetical protein L2D01_00290 [Hyphomonadaceae bacterium ML37]